MNEYLHSLPPGKYFILVTGNLEPYAILLCPHHGHISELYPVGRCKYFRHLQDIELKIDSNYRTVQVLSDRISTGLRKTSKQEHVFGICLCSACLPPRCPFAILTVLFHFPLFFFSRIAPRQPAAVRLV